MFGYETMFIAVANGLNLGSYNDVKQSSSMFYSGPYWSHVWAEFAVYVCMYVHCMYVFMYVCMTYVCVLVCIYGMHGTVPATGKCQNETRSNAFGSQTQTRLRSPRPSNGGNS